MTEMNSTSDSGKPKGCLWATQLKSHLCKLVFSVALLSIAVILLTIAITSDFESTTDSHLNNSGHSDGSTTTLPLDVAKSSTTPAPTPNSQTKGGNVVIDKGTK